jgi:hypothetical protein
MLFKYFRLIVGVFALADCFKAGSFGSQVNTADAGE